MKNSIDDRGFVPNYRSYCNPWLHHSAGMDEKAIRRAALVTVRRAVLQRFPPGLGDSGELKIARELGGGVSTVQRELSAT